MCCGDNVNSCHDMVVTFNLPDQIVKGYCRNCKKQATARPKSKLYKELYRRDTLQAHGKNLYYKYYGKMNVYE